MQTTDYRLKGYVFKNKLDSFYYLEEGKGTARNKSEAHVYSVAEIEGFINIRSGWGRTCEGTWKAVWEKR